MMNIAKFLLLFVALIPSAELLAKDTCDLDQKAVLQELISITDANPGGILDKEHYRVSWTDVNNKTVQVEHSGCVDLGSSVTLQFQGHIDVRTAVSELITATSKYWSPRQATEVARVLSAKQFTTNYPATDILEFEVDSGTSQAFPFGFTLILQSNKASLSWQEL